MFWGVWAAHRGKGLTSALYLSLASCVDIVPGAVFVPVAWVMLNEASGPGRRARSAAGLLVGVALFVAANLAVVGYPLPAKLVPGGLDFSSRISQSVAGVLLPDTWWYPLECLFGSHGLFTVSPVLVVGALGLWQLMAGRPGFLSRRSALALGGGVGVMTLGHIVLVGSYGGWAYGFRYLIPVIPLLMWCGAEIFDHRRMRRPLAAVCTVSTLLALIGAYHPWPPAYTRKERAEEVTSRVRNPIGGNLTALVYEQYPDSALAEKLVDLVISGDRRDQLEYLLYFYLTKRDQAAADEIQRRAPAPR